MQTVLSIARCLPSVKSQEEICRNPKFSQNFVIVSWDSSVVCGAFESSGFELNKSIWWQINEHFDKSIKTHVINISNLNHIPDQSLPQPGWYQPKYLFVSSTHSSAHGDPHQDDHGQDDQHGEEFVLRSKVECFSSQHCLHCWSHQVCWLFSVIWLTYKPEAMTS